MEFVEDDGGRTAAGFKGRTGDCAVRAIAIATELPYGDVYDGINLIAKTETPAKSGKQSNSRTGVFRHTVANYLEPLGWKWTPTMGIGSGCTVHMNPAELPSGRLVVRLSRHFAAVIDGVLHDTYDSSRDETRCVYGYWTP